MLVVRRLKQPDAYLEGRPGLIKFQLLGGLLFEPELSLDCWLLDGKVGGVVGGWG
jgi:hypothetical protein